jgi:RNA polymerase sigma factor (sigma-70 family)
MTDQTTVYVVDDDSSVRKATSRMLRAAGFPVVTFDSAEEFLDYPVSDKPGCLILDLEMPGLSGIELQDELVTRESLLPIVFMTGHGDIPTTVAAMKRGAVDFLPKPVDDEVLLATVRQAVERHAQELAQTIDVKAFKQKLSLLTKREHEVMMLVIDGLLNKQIAKRLGVTESTVKVHRGRMIEKTEVDSVAELVRLCERCGMKAGNYTTKVQ